MTGVVDCSFVTAVALGELVPPSMTDTFAFLSRSNDLELAVPAIWPSEVANALIVALRRNRIDLLAFHDKLRMCLALPPQVSEPPESEILSAVVALALRHQLTVYDALYVELALRTRSVLASLDGAMLRAARSEGVAVLGDPD